MNRRLLLTMSALMLMGTRCDQDPATLRVRWSIKGEAASTGCASVDAGRVEVDFGSSATGHFYTATAGCGFGELTVPDVRVADVSKQTPRYTARLFSADSSLTTPLTIASSDVAPLPGSLDDFEMVIFVNFFVDGVLPTAAVWPDAGSDGGVDAGAHSDGCDAGAPDAGACGHPFEPCCAGGVCLPGIQCTPATFTCG